MTQAPKIDERQFQDFLKQARELVPFYAPEWDSEDEQDPGVALVKIFAHMMETVVNRLDRAPDKNLVAFLDMLRVKLVPAQAARAPLTFILSSGAAENVVIPERTQAAAGEVLFETEKTFVAAPAKLTGAWSVRPGADEIFQSPAEIVAGKPVSVLPSRLAYDAAPGSADIFLDEASGLAKGDAINIGEAEYALVSGVSEAKVTLTEALEKPHSAGTAVSKVTQFELFQGKNRQEHVLYFAHKDLFQIKPTPGVASRLSLKFALSEPAGQALSLEWGYWGEDKATKSSRWIAIAPETDGTTGFTKTGAVALPIGSATNEAEVHGVKSRWLRCKLNKPLEPGTRLPSLGRIAVVLQNTVAPDLAFFNDVPLDLGINEKTHNFKEYVYPFGQKPRAFDVFYLGDAEAFSKKGATITLDLSSPGTGDVPVVDIYGIGPTFGKRLEEAGVKTIDDLLKYSATELMDILKTNKADQVENIISAAKKKYIEAGRRKRQMSLAARRAASGESQADVNLSWEYWNGNGWVVINGLHDETESFQVDGRVVFQCPDDIANTKVAGQESSWIRVKIAGGDYGKDFVYDSTTKQWVPGDIYPPLFSRLTITYELDAQPIEHCLSCNNLEFADVSDQAVATDKPFQPFAPLADAHQTMYLGFDRKLVSGPLSVFFSIEEARYTEDNMPRVEWEYLAKKEQTKEWTRLEGLDGTRNLTLTGTIEFVAPPDFAACSLFGEELFWVRVVDVDDKFEALPEIYLKVVDKLPPKYRTLRFLPRFASESLMVSAARRAPMLADRGAPRESPPTPCASPYSETFQPLWGNIPEMSNYAPNPKINGLYLNTTWALQSETVNDEVLGSSDGTAGQTFSLVKTPVTSADIWVNEINALSEGQAASMSAGSGLETESKQDAAGNISEFWVKWTEVENLLDSKKDDRHYELDRVAGKIKFGDGVNGAIPPVGTNNIKADYRCGGGTKGNLDQAVITGLKTSIPFVDKVTNPQASAGGSETESLDSAMERGPQTLRNRGRSVGADDFEWLAREASPAIARAKCLPDFDDRGERKPGWVTVIIVPVSTEDKPQPSLELQSRVQDYLTQRSANTVVTPDHLQVSGPVYVAVSVEAELFCTEIDAIPQAQAESLARLKSFLHPLTGGCDGKGWDFGKMPCLSDFFALLEKVSGVDHVGGLTVRGKAGEGRTLTEFAVSTTKPSDIVLPGYALIYSAAHDVTVSFQKES